MGRKQNQPFQLSFNRSFCFDERFSVCSQLSGQLKRKFWVKPRVAKFDRFAEGV